MARKTIFVSDFSGKEIDEDNAQTVRIQGPEGDWFSLDGTEKEIQDALGKFMSDEYNANSEIMQEQEQKFSVLLKRKIESGELQESSATRSSARRTRADGGTVSSGGSGLSNEDKATLRRWWEVNAEEMKEKFNVEYRGLGRFPGALVEYWTEQGKPSA